MYEQLRSKKAAFRNLFDRYLSKASVWSDKLNTVFEFDKKKVVELHLEHIRSLVSKIIFN